MRLVVATQTDYQQAPTSNAAKKRVLLANDIAIQELTHL
jgi:hypothetical protein